MKFEASITKQPRKKRLAQYHAALNEKRKLVFVHLSKELRKKYKKRALQAKKDDKVLVARGEHKKRQGKVIEVDVAHSKLYVEGVISKKQGGKEKPVALDPSNCILVEYNEPKLKQKKAKSRTAPAQQTKTEKTAANQQAAPKNAGAKPMAETPRPPVTQTVMKQEAARQAQSSTEDRKLTTENPTNQQAKPANPTLRTGNSQ